MSAGAFTKSIYQTDAGLLVPIRIQPETLAAAFGTAGTNAPAQGPTQVAGTYNLNLNNRRRKPFSARYVAVRFTGTLPDGYGANQTLKIPILTLALFNNLIDGTTGTYLGQAIRVQYGVTQRGRI